MTEELAENLMVEKTPFVFSRSFMAMNHNYLCACCKEHSAVQECNTGILQPCYRCQKTGFRIVKTSRLAMWFLDKLGLVR